MQGCSQENSYTIRLKNNKIATYEESNPYELKIYTIGIAEGNGEGCSMPWKLLETRNLRLIEANVLAMLLANKGEIVSSKRLQQISTNGERFVTDNNIRQAIYSLRAAFDDVVIPHQIIRNKPRLGYSIHCTEPNTEGIETAILPQEEIRVENSQQSILIDVNNQENSEEKITEINIADSEKNNKTSEVVTEKHSHGYRYVLLLILLGCFGYFFYYYHQDKVNHTLSFDSYTEQLTPNIRLTVLTTQEVTPEMHNNINILKESLKEGHYMMAKDAQVLNVIFYQLRKDITIKCVTDKPELTLTSVNLTTEDFSSTQFREKILENCVNHVH